MLAPIWRAKIFKTFICRIFMKLDTSIHSLALLAKNHVMIANLISYAWSKSESREYKYYLHWKLIKKKFSIL